MTMTRSKSEFIKEHLRSWFQRKTENLSVNQVSEYPIVLATDKGVHRTENQDRVAVLEGEKTDGASYVVSVLSDGMGGMKNGSDCASITVSSFISHIIENINSSNAIDKLLVSAAEAANQDVYKHYKQSGGATLSAVVYIEGYGFGIVNAGDSRVYSSLPSEIVQLTEDDTLAAQVNRSGEWPSNELLQYVGMGEDFQPHIRPFSISQVDARLLLTSDGVHFMEPKTIFQMIKSADNPKQLGRRLIEISKWLGSRDNASVIVIDNFNNFASPNDLMKKGPDYYRVFDAYATLEFMAFVEPSLPNQEIKENTDVPSSPKDKKTPRKRAKRADKAAKREQVIPEDKNDDSNSEEIGKLEKAEKKPQLKISFE